MPLFGGHQSVAELHVGERLTQHQPSRYCVSRRFVIAFLVFIKGVIVKSHPVIIPLVAIAFLTACSDTAPLSPSSADHTTRFNTQASADSAYWIDNVMEFTYGGHLWRIERDHEDATAADVIRDNLLVTSVDLGWEGGGVTAVTGRKDGEWISITTSGQLIATSRGVPGDGPIECEPDDGGPIGEPGEGDECDKENLLTEDDCSDELSEAVSAGNDALAAGLVGIITSKVPGVNLATVGYFAFKVADFGGKALDYGVCRIFGGGGDTAVRNTQQCMDVLV
jgi:hypothetical protein